MEHTLPFQDLVTSTQQKITEYLIGSSSLFLRSR